MRITSCEKHARLAQAAVALFVALFIAPTAFASDTDNFLIVDGIGVHYAVLPTEMIRGHPKQHSEATMHGASQGSVHSHHVMVALFEGDSLERITDAAVTATVAEVGLAGSEKQLEPFVVAGALTYGNYFEMQPNALYRISVGIKRPGSPKIATAEFDYKHH